MSVTVTTDIFCDRCGDWMEGVSGRTFVDKRLARRKARTEGWVYKYDHTENKYKDFCPNCKKQIKKIRKINYESFRT